MPGNALFIGHSLVGPVMPAMFNSFMSDQGLSLRADAQIINGAPLRWNWDNGSSAQGVNARDVLPTGAYDAVIVTEAIPLDDQIRWNDTQGYAKLYYDLAVTSNPATQFYIYETWHDIGSDTAAWRTQIATDLPKWEGIADHINATRQAAQPEALIIPAGQALGRLHDAIEAGQVPGLTDIRDLFSDSIHFNDIGAWFIAALQAEVIAGIDATQLPLNTSSPFGVPYDGPDAAMAQAMNAVIDQTLASYQRDGSDGGGTVAPAPAPPTPLPPDPDPDPAPTPVQDDIQTVDRGLGFGLTGIADFSTASPFLDVFKTSRPFLGHENGQWGGIDHAELLSRGLLDTEGWPTAIPASADSIGTVILTELPAEMTDAAGRYRVTWSGEGELEIGLGARDITYGQNEVWFSFIPDGESLVSLNILSTNAANNLRNIEVVHERHIASIDRGEVFNPVWLDIIRDAHALRFMDWMDTNNSTVSTPLDAPQVADASWSSGGVPLEIMIRLANETQTDPWFTLPHRATDAYMRDFVAEVRATLDPTLTPYFEFSNEVWNWQFNQAQEAHAEGQARFGGVPDAWVQNYAADAVRMAEIVDIFYGTDSPDVVKVIATQTGWQGLEDAILNAPQWMAEDPGNRPPPSTYFDAYAVTGYFDGGLGQDAKAQTVLGWIADSLSRAERAADAQGLTGQARAEYIDAHRYDHATTLAVREIADGSVTGNPLGSIAELTDFFAYHKAQADAAGLELIMYEGGSHIVGIGAWQNNTTLTEFFTHLNYTPEMGALYDNLMQQWLAAGGTLYNAFTAVNRASEYGSWGHLRHVNDTNPRMDAVEDFLAAFPRDGVIDRNLLSGSEAENSLTGTSGADLILGLGGDDRLAGGAGEDHLHGGAGWDVAVLAGNQNAYTLALSAAGIEVTHRSGTSSDRLTQIEELAFDGGAFNLAQVAGTAQLSASQLESLIELYIAYFNRAPDAIGLNFWGTVYGNGMDLPDIAAAFIDHPETRGLYPDGTSTRDFITSVYTNVLGRPFDAEGFTFWQNALESGAVARPQFILAILDGAKAAPPGGASADFIAQQYADRAYLTDKTEIGAVFAVHRGLSDVRNADAVMSLFDGSSASRDRAIAHTEDVYDQTVQPEGGFLMPLLGVLEQPDWF